LKNLRLNLLEGPAKNSASGAGEILLAVPENFKLNLGAKN
jgi:hypothetical protein